MLIELGRLIEPAMILKCVILLILLLLCVLMYSRLITLAKGISDNGMHDGQSYVIIVSVHLE